MLDIAPNAGPVVIALCTSVAMIFLLIAWEWFRQQKTWPPGTERRTLNWIFSTLAYVVISSCAWRVTCMFYVNIWLLVLLLVPLNIMSCICWLRLRHSHCFFRVVSLGPKVANRDFSDALASCPAGMPNPRLAKIADEIRMIAEDQRRASRKGIIHLTN